MKVKKNYIFRQIANENLLIPTGEAALSAKGLIALSDSARLLFQRLQEDCEKEDLIAMLIAEYDVSEAVAAEDIDAFLDQMRQLNMLEE